MTQQQPQRPNPTPQAKAVRRAVLAWFRRNGRELPWRNTKDPYKIWISEVMLQQTQVTRVMLYYDRFLRRFPSLESLSRASWREVLPLWRGLGYYRRGENLLRTAKLIHSVHAGKFPSDASVLRTLPGIGNYTAAAIQSFAFGKSVPAIDTNLNRVTQRIFGIPQAQVEQSLTEMFSAVRHIGPRLNHALMDLGSLVCYGKNPDCVRCPLKQLCRSAFQFEAPRRTKGSKRIRPTEYLAVACIWREKDSYLLIRHRNHWSFPSTAAPSRALVRESLKKHVKNTLGVEISVRPPFSSQTVKVRNAWQQIEYCRSRILHGSHRKLLRTGRWVEKKELKKNLHDSRMRKAVSKLPA